MEKQRSLAERFWEKVDIRGPNECWPWTGYINTDGYGHYSYSKKDDRVFGEMAHRMALRFDGRDSGPLQGCHQCDNPACCNPRHLWVGTAKQNSDDAARKGRLVPGPSLPGESHPNRKLTDQIVRDIRALHEIGFTQTALAEKFNIDQSSISLIVNRKRWRHI